MNATLRMVAIMIIIVKTTSILVSDSFNHLRNYFGVMAKQGANTTLG